MSADFVLSRADDLVLLGVRWSNAHVVEGGVLEADADAVLTLVFPPQHVAEQVDVTGSAPAVVDGMDVWASRLSAKSTVSFRPAAGTRIPLTVEGVLQAASIAAYDRAGTVIELPWRLHIAPDAATWAHASRPVRAPDGTVGLWRTRAVPPTDAPLAISAVDDGAAQADDPFPVALDKAARTTIAAAATSTPVDGIPRPAHATRLELTTLGGSLTAAGAWEGFAWQHDAALGRDIHVHTVSQLRMYPFDLRAELSEVSDRVFDAASGEAVLRKVITLQFLDPVKDLARDGATAREFPFDRVQVLQPTYAGLPPQSWTFFERGSPILADLETERAVKAGRADELQPIVASAQTADRSVEQLAAEGMPQAQRWLELQSAIGAIDAELGPAEQAWADAGPLFDQLSTLQSQIDSLSNGPVGPDGFLDPSVTQQINELSAQINDINAQLRTLPSQQFMQSLRNQRAPLASEAAANWAAVEPETTRDRSIEELVASGMPEAVELNQLNAEIAALDGRIAVESTATIRDVPWYFTPRDISGVIRFPLRLRGDAGDVDLSIPMVAVREFTLPANASLPEFSSVDDPQTVSGIEAEWRAADAANVPLAPTRIDLVRSAQSAPGDVRVVHALQLVGAVVSGSYLPRLEQFDIELPDVSTLLSSIAPTPYRYARDFLESDAADLVFETVGEAIDLSFVEDARNAGALLSPRILADGLSRTLGPVSIDGIQSAADGLFDASRLFADGATLLGFDLASLVKKLPVPPAIVTDLLEGRPPVVRMTWKNVPLHTEGAFVAGEGALLDLEVVSGPDASVITCAVRGFSLALPSVEDELLRLTFGELRFEQRPGKSPSLDVKGLSADFRGDFRLLKVLQDAVGLGDAGPSVAASPSGIVAKYDLPIAPVAAGAFQLRDIVFHAGIDVPFGSEPPSVTIGFASRERPFIATVLMFGGGGYIDLALDHRGIRRLEASIEFGASIGVDFFVASAEVHVLGGIRYSQVAGGGVSLSGYLRIGGSVQILGLVSISIELLLALSYDGDLNQLAGRATLVVELDLTLYSTSVELDSGPWVISGGPADRDRAIGARADAVVRADDGKAGATPDAAERARARTVAQDWLAYRKAFA